MNKTFNEIPSGLQDVSVCFCTFHKVIGPLECEEKFAVTDKVVKCIILITKLNTLIEIENGCVKRIKDLKIKNVSKVIVHHEFEPFSRFIVLLTTEKTAHLLDYQTIENINSWNNISNISSEDISEEGKPKLILKKVLGASYIATEGDFLIHQNQESQESSRTDAVVALNNKLKSIVWLSESVEAETNRKEVFICRKISDLSSQLQSKQSNIQITNASDLQSMVAESQTPSTTKDSQSTSHSYDNNILKIINTRHRIVHNKWVICVAIVNLSDRQMIRNPELVLHSENKSLNCLHYKSRLLKTYQMTHSKESLKVAYNSEITIEDVEPPVLKPKKKAFLLAICDFPDFSFGDSLSCCGLITFRTRNMKSDVEEEDSVKQMPFPSIQLDARNLKTVCVDITREQGSAGISFELFTLIAASKCYVLTVKSVVSPLDQFVETMAKDSRIIKIRGINEFYCFYIPECPPLHHAAFICKPLSANQLLLKIYIKDDNQGLILIHNLNEFLPFDAFITSEKKSCLNSYTADNSLQKTLLSKMNIIIGKLTEVYEKPRVEKIQEKKTKTNESKSKSVSFTHRNEMEEKEFITWRKDICEHSFQLERLLQQYKE